MTSPASRQPNRQPAGVPTGGQFAPDARGRADIEITGPDGTDEPDAYGENYAAVAGGEPTDQREVNYRAIEAALDERLAAERKFEAAVSHEFARVTRANYPDAVAVGLGWNDEDQRPCFGFKIVDGDGDDVMRYDDDDDSYIDDMNDLARHLRHRVDPDIIARQPDRETLMVPLSELESATVEPDEAAVERAIDALLPVICPNPRLYDQYRSTARSQALAVLKGPQR